MSTGKSAHSATFNEPLKTRKVIIELRPSAALAAASGGAAVRNTRYGGAKTFHPANLLPGIDIDPGFTPTSVPAQDHDALKEEQPETRSRTRTRDTNSFNFIVRADVSDEQLRDLAARPEVIGVFSDLLIEPFLTCYGPAVGTHTDVERLLCVSKLKSRGLDGSDVLLAIVDTGINLDYLNAHGKGPNFDRGRSWVNNAGPAGIPGQWPVNHGTMCAFDACIAAPRCTLLDIALLSGNSDFATFLSDAVKAYEHLLNAMIAPLRPGESRSLVVSNSWGVFSLDGDFPEGQPGNYSDNLNHPFNRIVTALEHAGADILFAAGNCGPDCPDGRCGFVTDRTIYGANSHPAVTCVAGVDTSRARVGYSSIGPGSLTNRKPDICGYTHFAGSEVDGAPDSGTSAACPVVAGVVAALRTRWQYDPASAETHPAAVREILTHNAFRLPTLAKGYDYKRGHGTVQGCPLADMFILAVVDPPRLAPSISDALKEFCHRHPELCPGVKFDSRLSPERDAATRDLLLRLIEDLSETEDGDLTRSINVVLEAYLTGYLQYRRRNTAAAPRQKDCACSGD
jgi:hypothetical protein